MKREQFIGFLIAAATLTVSAWAFQAAGDGSYFRAFCSDKSHPSVGGKAPGWSGPPRPSKELASFDADKHNKQYKGHQATAVAGGTK